MAMNMIKAEFPTASLATAKVRRRATMNNAANGHKTPLETAEGNTGGESGLTQELLVPATHAMATQDSKMRQISQCSSPYADMGSPLLTGKGKQKERYVAYTP